MGKAASDGEKRMKGAWTKQEDEKLISYIKARGEGSWKSIPRAAGLLRCGKSCRLRWINYLRPDVKRGNFSKDEEDLIIRLHALLGNRWSLIAGRIPGRTDNEIENHWNSHLRKELLKMGIDPDNHRLSQIVGFHQSKGMNARGEHHSLDHHHGQREVAPAGNSSTSYTGGTVGYLPDLNLNPLAP